jgi:hypothetical protein
MEETGIASHQMNPLLERALVFLEHVYDPERALFPFATTLEGGRYSSTFENPVALRYSINCLLGLKEAARHDVSSSLVRECDALVERFVTQHYSRITNFGDLGLLLVLLADGFEAGPAEDALRRIEKVAAVGRAAALPLQDACWMLWGAVALARAGVIGAERLAEKLFRDVERSFLNPDSLLPRHANRAYRRNSVSFGALTYFLRAVHEYATCFGDESAASLFRLALARVQRIQGPHGEWPWLIEVNTGVPIDYYPVYSVHQDSMSMLFLLPALDHGLPGVRESIERSYAWVLGDNAASTPMIVDEPFFRYRSLERRGGFQRLRRYVRSLPGVVRVSRRLAIHAAGVRINRECRSYEMGWIVFAWAGRRERLAVRQGDPPIQFES